jgi:drug/metabolite transporter (DMT)-like permease
MEAGEAQPRYNGAAVAGAVLATLFFPLIALIAALILLGNERSPRRRSQLRTWAWASGGLMVVGGLLFVLAFVTVGNGSGGF